MTYDKQYKENGFQSPKIIAKDLANVLEMNPEEAIFLPKNSLRRKKPKNNFLTKRKMNV